MKAAQISTYGGPSVIEINEVDTPTINSGQVLVEVHAASLNPFDTKLREGYMKDSIPLHFPFTLGGDIAGTVVEISDGVADFAVGDAVYGQAAGVAGNSGAFAQYTAVKTTSIAKAPVNLNFDQAASLPLVGVSALQALNEHLNLQSGQKIFIHGGAGGIGTIAIQVAKHIGAYVATTATGDSINNVTSLGADEVIDYKKTDFTEVLSNYDAVFDTVGDDFNKTLAILKKGGIAVSMAAQADEDRVNELEIQAISQFTKVTTASLDALRQLIESDVIAPQVGKLYTLEDTSKAFETLEFGTVNGKIVLEMK